MKHTIFALGAFVLLSAACAPKIARPTPNQLVVAKERWPEVTFEELEQGRRLYLKRCGDCHDLPPPTSRSAEQWPAIVEDMGEYAQYDATQTNLVLRFIVSARETPPANPSGEDS